MEPILIYDLTIYNLLFRCTRFMIEEGACRDAQPCVSTMGRTKTDDFPIKNYICRINN